MSEDWTDDDMEMVFKCKKCPDKFFTAAEKDSHRLWHRRNDSKTKDDLPSQPNRKIKSNSTKVYYNAIILDKQKKVTGRTHLTDLSNYPPEKWRVTYNGKIISSSSQLKDIPAGPNNPLKILTNTKCQENAKPGKSSRQEIIVVDLDSNETDDEEEEPPEVPGPAPKKIKFADDESEPRPAQKIYRKCPLKKSTGGPSVLASMKKKCGGYARNGARSRSTGSAGPARKISTLRGKTVGRRTACRLKDLEGERTTERGHLLPEHAEETWMAFAAGINVEGVCENTRCISHKTNEKPILRWEYGNSSLREDLLACPACGHRTLKPGNIIISVARSAFHYRKSGVAMGNFTLMEHFGSFPEYMTPDEGNDNVDYDVIEITTVRPNESPFLCRSCDEAILKKDKEHKKNCGHYFHKKCRFNECPICSSEYISEVPII